MSNSVSKSSVLLCTLFLVFTATGNGQNALDGFDPNANGLLRSVVVQGDGKILIGGDFTSLAPNGGVTISRNRIARLNPDGTLDAAFNPNADGSIEAIAVQADGKILVGGNFTTIGGQNRSRIARLDPITGLADSFDPNSNDAVACIAVQADGKILAGGYFTTVGGQTRNYIARLDAWTGLADSFDPNANNNVRAILLQADGKIVVGGAFHGANSIGGQARNRIARLDLTTGLADSFDPNANSEVYAIALQADRRILIGGAFGIVSGQIRQSIARLDSETGLPDSFDPAANGSVVSIVVQRDGKIVVAGFFHGTNSIGGQTRNGIARLDRVTGLADSFDPNMIGANGIVLSIATQADGKIVAGGNFTTLAPNGGATITRNRIARIETDGRVDQTLNSPFGGGTEPRAILCTAVQRDGKILIGGNFDTILGVTRHNIARLNADGTLDLTFDSNISYTHQTVNSIVVQADGKILVGGYFSSTPATHIARLDPTTGIADSFNASANEQIYSIALQADGKILVGGRFTSIGGQPRNYFARLDPNTGLADSINPDPSYWVHSLVVQPDGRILVGGYFTTIGGQPRNYVARLDPITGLADSFNPNSNNYITSVALQSDGKVLVGGNFFTIGGQSRLRIARLDATTGLADSFDPHASGNPDLTIIPYGQDKILVCGGFTQIGGQQRNRIARLDAATGQADSFDPNADGAVLTIAVQPDGKILAGGVFGNIGGQPRNVFARLSSDTAVQQNISVTETAIVWMAAAGIPPFARVTFESSEDNVSYVSLGNGTPAGNSVWTVTDLNLPTGINFYVRARGYYRGGYRNASESFIELVQNAFLTASAPTPTPSATPVSISGTISNCTNSVPNPVPSVVLNLTGDTTGSTVSDASGNCQFSFLPAEGTYTITPSKSSLAPGSAGINTLDVVAVQRHFLNIGTSLSGCPLIAADVNAMPLSTRSTLLPSSDSFWRYPPELQIPVRTASVR